MRNYEDMIILYGQGKEVLPVNVVRFSPEARRGGPTYIWRTHVECVVADVKGWNMEPGRRAVEMSVGTEDCEPIMVNQRRPK
jgi:hypothetical protein